MKNDSKTPEELKTEAMQDLREQLDSFLNMFSEKIKDVNEFITMDEIETLFAKLDSETRKIYLNLVSSMLNGINERELIQSKKANLPKRG